MILLQFALELLKSVYVTFVKIITFFSFRIVSTLNVLRLLNSLHLAHVS